ncbi:MAG: penicillin-binding protein, partial [Actinomycetota bacterium]|nr:penicillin-binding protein [Actinomycetota bacterium]
IFSAHRLNTSPVNTRAVVRDFNQPRGSIQTSDGVVIAESIPTPGDQFERLRQYPQGELFAHLTGYFSFTYGTEGVERTYNEVLTGRSKKVTLNNLGDLLLEKDSTANVTLTVSSQVQQVATEELAGRKGAVVAIDPRDGAILAAADYPSYDPNPLSAHDQKTVRTAWDSLNADTDKPLLPRFYRERYFPGSSFKVVTAATGLATGVATLTRPVYPELSELDLPGSGQPLRNFGGETCGGPLPEILRISCNTAFAQLGLDIGGPKMSAGADSFGFNKTPPIDLPSAAKSLFPDPSAFVRDKPGLAKSAIGQQDVQATPMQMALVASAIANGGVIMTPHVMKEVTDSKAEVIDTYSPKPWLTAVPAKVAADTKGMMVGVVEDGTGTRAQIPGVTVAGKTGTAQTGLGTSHTWFIAFAPAEAPTVAVAVMLENQSSADEATGGALAAPIARTVMEAVLGGQ